MGLIILKFKCKNCGLVKESNVIRQWDTKNLIYDFRIYSKLFKLNISYTSQNKENMNLDIFLKDDELNNIHDCCSNQVGIKELIGFKIE